MTSMTAHQYPATADLRDALIRKLAREPGLDFDVPPQVRYIAHHTLSPRDLSYAWTDARWAVRTLARLEDGTFGADTEDGFPAGDQYEAAADGAAADLARACDTIKYGRAR